MKREQLIQSLQREISLPERLGLSYHFQLRAVLGIIFGASCWTAVVWLVWNHALTNLLDFGGIGPVLSLVPAHSCAPYRRSWRNRADRWSEPGV